MISLIVGCDKNWVIGNGSEIPWHLPADFAYLKKTTMGHPLVMGRKTFESIGKPLPGRLNIIVTRDSGYNAPFGSVVVGSVEEGIEVAQKEETGEVFIFGGSGIYKYALENDLVDRAYVTHIDAEVEGDILFPGNLISDWVRTSRTYRPADEKNEYNINFSIYEKRVVVSGKELAVALEDRLIEQVENLDEKPTLGIYVVGQDAATRMYVKKKRELAGRIGVDFKEFLFEMSVTENELEQHIKDNLDSLDGVVIQLPLPNHIDRDKICNLIPPIKDPDLLNQQTMATFIGGDMTVLPPVVSAIDEIIDHYNLNPAGKNILVIGRGKLVGGPSITYFEHKGANVDSVDKEDTEFTDQALAADIIVSGAGVSDLVTPEMIKEGSILFDGGTSGSSGSLRGDIDWGCSEKARLFSRSPGGIGPLTVVSLFKNFLILVEKNKN